MTQSFTVDQSVLKHQENPLAPYYKAIVMAIEPTGIRIAIPALGFMERVVDPYYLSDNMNPLYETAQ